MTAAGSDDVRSVFPSVGTELAMGLKDMLHLT